MVEIEKTGKAQRKEERKGNLSSKTEMGMNGVSKNGKHERCISFCEWKRESITWYEEAQEEERDRETERESFATSEALLLLSLQVRLPPTAMSTRELRAYLTSS